MEPEKMTKGTRARNDIIATAHTLFAEQGYHGTSMRQIAEKAGITLGGIYNHFSGKEDIFQSLIIEYHPISDVVTKLENIRGSNVSETVHFAAQTIQSTLQERGDYINLLFAELIEFQGEHINTVFGEVFPQAVDISGKLLEGRELRSKNIPLMFLIFISLMFVFFIFNRFINQRSVGKLIKLDLKEAVHLFLYGITTDSEEGRI
ncbi:MAG: TetR/AcrR family transcriptional regulator [Anaerolineales bacterium]